MKKTSLVLASLGVLIASVIATFLTDKQTPLAFVAWAIFFAVITFPAVFFRNDLTCYFTRK